MPKVAVKVNRMPQLGAPQFTRPEMKAIGEAVENAETLRIKTGKMPDGSSAKPLAVHEKNGKRRGYAIQKQRKVGKNIRDWTLTGAMLESLRTTASDPTLAVIKFGSVEIKKAFIRQAKDGMFGLSAGGSRAGSDKAQQYWDKAVKRANKA